MKLPSLLLASTLLATTAQAQLPHPADLLGLPRKVDDRRIEIIHPGHLQHHAQASAHGKHVFLHLPGQHPVAIYKSDANIRGVLASADGRLVAVVEGTGSAGDWITFLHRIDQRHGSRFVAESLHESVEHFVDLSFKLDLTLKKKPTRLRISPVAVFQNGDLQFTITGDRDLHGRALTLVLRETGRASLLDGCDH